MARDACCPFIRTIHEELSPRATNRLLEISQLVPVGLTVAEKDEILINVARSQTDKASKRQSILRKELAHMKPNEMHQVDDQNNLDSLFS